MRLHDFLDYWARLQPEAEFAVQGVRRVTWGAAADVNRLARALAGAGLRAGDRAAILAKNSIEYLYAYRHPVKAPSPWWPAAVFGWCCGRRRRRWLRRPDPGRVEAPTVRLRTRRPIRLRRLIPHRL